jgi:DDE superfamily endonuclease
LVYLISVDGTHCRINEPRHIPSSGWYSHKSHSAGLNYEIAVNLHESKVVWINGPFPAGRNDRSVYTQAGGLQSMIPPSKKVIADKGYRSQNDVTLSTPNPFDSDIVKTFKKRASARHETLNQRIKNFEVLAGCFRHNIAKHQCVFEAICVIVQYDMESGYALFDI